MLYTGHVGKNGCIGRGGAACWCVWLKCVLYVLSFNLKGHERNNMALTLTAFSFPRFDISLCKEITTSAEEYAHFIAFAQTDMRPWILGGIED